MSGCHQPPCRSTLERATLDSGKSGTGSNQDAEVAGILRNEGFNVETTREAGLDGQDDSSVFAHARRTGRVLVTHDRDFLDNRAFPLRPGPGVAILTGGDGNREQLWRSLVYLCRMGSMARFWENAKIIVGSEGTFTVNQIDATGATVTTRSRFGPGGRPEVWED
jgi:predicted nuclease of predicted toxin-antitoxin system